MKKIKSALIRVRWKRPLYYITQTLIVVAVIATIVYAQTTWVNPTASPPGGNIAAPLNTETTLQIKKGPLTINGKLTAAGGLDVTGNINVTGTGGVTAPKFCIGTSCVDAWSAGGWILDDANNRISTAKTDYNVGIGTTELKLPAPNNKNGNLDVNDVWLRARGDGIWLSKLGTNIVKIQISTLSGGGDGCNYLGKGEGSCYPNQLTANAVCMSKGHLYALEWTSSVDCCGYCIKYSQGSWIRWDCGRGGDQSGILDLWCAD
jgi:hypothetical protein